MEQYSIILPNEKATTYRYVTLFILLINVFVFGFIFFTTIDTTIKNCALAGTVICALSLVIFISNTYRKKQSYFRSEFSFIIVSILWLMMGKFLLALCIIMFAIIGFYTNRKFVILITTQKIEYPSFPKKIILWDEVNNMMLKDNILTIDLKNNRLIQVLVAKESAEAINELSFNEFCKKQVSAGT